jgi:hypothetical protein
VVSGPTHYNIRVCLWFYSFYFNFFFPKVSSPNKINVFIIKCSIVRNSSWNIFRIISPFNLVLSRKCYFYSNFLITDMQSTSNIRMLLKYIMCDKVNNFSRNIFLEFRFFNVNCTIASIFLAGSTSYFKLIFLVITT